MDIDFWWLMYAIMLFELILYSLLYMGEENQPLSQHIIHILIFLLTFFGQLQKL